MCWFFSSAVVFMNVNVYYFVVIKVKVRKKKVNTTKKDSKLLTYFNQGKSKYILFSREEILLDLNITFDNDRIN